MFFSNNFFFIILKRFTRAHDILRTKQDKSLPLVNLFFRNKNVKKKKKIDICDKFLIKLRNFRKNVEIFKFDRIDEFLIMFVILICR